MRVAQRLAGLVAFALVVLLVTRGFRAREERRAPPANPEGEERSDALLAPVNPADERSPIEDPAASAPAAEEPLFVRSALGLALVEVELEVERGWLTRGLGAGGALVLPPSQRPVRIRARGHLAALADLGTRELVLEPHTALRFTSFPLAHVDNWTPTAHWENQRSAAELELLAGPLDATSWGIAFDADRLRGLFSYLALEFRFDDGTRANVDHQLSSGRIASANWPWSPDEVERSTLQLSVSGAGNLQGPFVLSAHAAADPHREARTDFVPFDWGTIERLRHAEAWELDGPAPRFELGPLVLGKDYIVTVRDNASGAHVRRRFTHDGTALELVLTDGLVVSGRVTFEPAVGLRELERAVWALGTQETPYWRGEPRPIPLGPEGEFRFTLPDPVPWADPAPFPRPTALELELRLPGFFPHLHTCDTAGVAELALGTIALTPRATAVTLAPGHGLEARELFDQSLVLGSDGGFARELLVAGGLPLADGSLALTLDAESVPPELRDCEALLLGIGEALIPLVRGTEGFQRVTLRPRVLRFDAGETLPGLGERLEVGLDWRGLLYSCRSWPTRALVEPTELELALPQDAEVWWGLGPRPESRHTIVLAGDGVVDVRLP